MNHSEQEKKVKILNAAIKCVNNWGLERLSMADIAKEANVARSTVYMYYKNRDEVIRAALLESAYKFGEKLYSCMAPFTTPQDRVIETMVYGINILPNEPFLAMISSSALSDMVREHTLSDAKGMDIGTAILQELLDDDQIPSEELREMSHFVVRFTLSLITMESPDINNDDQLRGFIARRLLPSLGLSVPTEYQRYEIDHLTQDSARSEVCHSPE